MNDYIAGFILVIFIGGLLGLEATAAIYGILGALGVVG